MKKNKQLNEWLWKWHFIAGMISLPFIVVLSITGIIYLFKTEYETPRQQHIKEVSVTDSTISLDKQWNIAQKNTTKKLNSIIIPTTNMQATEFISGRFGKKNSIFINPYTGEVSGHISPKNSLMFKVRKLHGELLMGSFGTKIIELIASWMIVLIITGLYIWWPARGWNIKGLFVPRINLGKRTLFRDLHAITGLWISLLLLMTLVGGFPWTDVFGSNFKWVQKITNTGFPNTWEGRQLKSNITDQPISLDQIVATTKTYNLPGEVTISLPKGKEGIYSISNSNPSNLTLQKKIHFDQYTGNIIHTNNWNDVGILMRGRQWFMAFHQGEFGLWNWILMLITAISLFLMSISAIFSYIFRKKKNNWGIPKVPNSFKIEYPIILILLLLAIIFPLFGISIVLIIIIEYYRTKNTKNNIFDLLKNKT